MNSKLAGEVHPPPLTTEEFEKTREFSRFKGIMRKLLKVPKSELDHRVRTAKATSPRRDNPKAPGMKKRTS